MPSWLALALLDYNGLSTSLCPIDHTAEMSGSHQILCCLVGVAGLAHAHGACGVSPDAAPSPKSEPTNPMAAFSAPHMTGTNAHEGALQIMTPTGWWPSSQQCAGWWPRRQRYARRHCCHGPAYSTGALSTPTLVNQRKSCMSRQE